MIFSRTVSQVILRSSRRGEKLPRGQPDNKLKYACARVSGSAKHVIYLFFITAGNDRNSIVKREQERVGRGVFFLNGCSDAVERTVLRS